MARSAANANTEPRHPGETPLQRLQRRQARRETYHALLQGYRAAAGHPPNFAYPELQAYLDYCANLSPDAAYSLGQDLARRTLRLEAHCVEARTASRKTEPSAPGPWRFALRAVAQALRWS